MSFTDEIAFENALINVLTSSCGWSPEIIKYPTEKDLLQNWANILFENNRSIDRLNDYPLTDGEMQQIIEQIKELKTPLKLNGFINGRSVSIIRDNPDDKEHFGKAVSLKIYDRREIAAGESRYQIAEQPIFKAKSSVLPNRRGDFMLLINGMPLFHIELKKSGVPVSQASNQIEKYAHEGIFTGLFALVQVFVAMNPEEALYFANPGPEGRFNPDYYFHWADFNNEPINDWKTIATTLLSIPMAHQLIGFYTVADDTDGVLKVMRSYQYYAANAISDTVSKNKWEKGNQLGGYIWHTTGSGKTMTSFKSAQLIANSKDADKVVFLIDRIELGTQSAQEYRGFAEATDSIQETEDTVALIGKLKSPDPADTLIVTSIQKMSNIKDDAEGKLKKNDLDTILSKRIVFIVDECHRDTFGDMMANIKNTFTKALFFGFTGTPIQLENEQKGCTTADVFGSELHRYSIADGIRDKNVLGFDHIKVLTFKEKDMRKAVALEKAKAKTEAEVFGDKQKEKIYYKYLNDVPMAGTKNQNGIYEKGIEDYMLTSGQYRTEEHRKMVISDILENWVSISHNKKFHAIFATSSIPEATLYYSELKKSDLKVTCLFDPSIDNNGERAIEKEDALIEIIEDYNKMYNQHFAIPTYAKMKKDIQNRLAHKRPYERIAANPNEQLDLFIVVDQMLTGYDSKWLNALYLDKVLKYQGLIQAFSRTNRLFGEDKPHGTIKYYRAPYTMARNIDEAFKTYSGDKPFGLFVIKLPGNIDAMNERFEEISSVFSISAIANFEKLPSESSSCMKFAKLFNEFNSFLESAKVQGFTWDKTTYTFVNEDTGEMYEKHLNLDRTTYLTLVQRYKELFGGGNGGGKEDSPYDLKGYITTIDTEDIDADYMNSRYKKYLKELSAGKAEEIEKAKEELHKTFATLSQEEQKYANIFLHEIQSGDVVPQPGKTLKEYICSYIEQAKNDKIHKVSIALGIDEELLRNIMAVNVDEKSINEFGRFDDLRKTINIEKAKAYFEKTEGKPIPNPIAVIKANKLLRDFVLSGEIDIQAE